MMKFSRSTTLVFVLTVALFALVVLGVRLIARRPVGQHPTPVQPVQADWVVLRDPTGKYELRRRTDWTIDEPEDPILSMHGRDGMNVSVNRGCFPHGLPQDVQQQQSIPVAVGGEKAIQTDFIWSAGPGRGQIAIRDVELKHHSEPYCFELRATVVHAQADLEDFQTVLDSFRFL